MNVMKYLTLFLASCAFFGLSVQGQRKVVAVGAVKLNDSIKQASKAEGRLVQMNRVVEALDGQLVNSLNGTRKFEVIARSDLGSLIQEGGVAGAGLQVGGSDYLLVATVDDFQDYTQTATFGSVGKTATKRVIRFGAVGKVYDSASGKLIESASFQISNKDISNVLVNAADNGELSDELLREIAVKMANQITTRVVDVIYPAKVVARTAEQVTINRGDGTGIASGQLWEAFAVGEEIIDPDTGESLGGNEVLVGSIRITRVTATLSFGTVVDDYGIAKGVIVRSKVE